MRLLVCISLVGAFICIAVAQATAQGILIGRVTDSVTGRPIALASAVFSNDTGVTRQESTSGRGEFTAIGLSLGQWTVTLEAPRYEPVTVDVMVTNGMNTPVIVSLSPVEANQPDSSWTLLRMESGELTAGIIGEGMGEGMTVAVMCVDESEAVMISLPQSFVFEHGAVHGLWSLDDEVKEVTEHQFQVADNALIAGLAGTPHLPDFVVNLQTYDSVWLAVTRFGGMLTPREIELVGSSRAIDALACS